MLTAVAFCPQAPALVPMIGRGLDDELGPVREACRTAIRRAADSADRVVIVARNDGTAGFGPDVDVPGVGEWLVRDALGSDVVGTVLTPEELSTADVHGPGRIALVAVGDGSARRTEKAPGYLDERAPIYDDEVAAALRSGDPARLAALDGELGGELLAGGVPAWRAVGGQLDGSHHVAELLYADAPFGVGYFVATWQLREATGA